MVFGEVFQETPGDENIVEWIELYNNSSLDFSIDGWTIPDSETIGTGTFYAIVRNNPGFATIVISRIFGSRKEYFWRVKDWDSRAAT